MYVEKLSRSSTALLINSSPADTLGGARVSWIFGVVYIAVALGLLFQAYIGVKTGRSSRFHVGVSVGAAVVGLCVARHKQHTFSLITHQVVLLLERFSVFPARLETTLGIFNFIMYVRLSNPS